MKSRNLTLYTLSAFACVLGALLLWNRGPQTTIAGQEVDANTASIDTVADVRRGEDFEPTTSAEISKAAAHLSSEGETVFSGKDMSSARISSSDVKFSNVSGSPRSTLSTRPADRVPAQAESGTNPITIGAGESAVATPLSPGEIEIAVPPGAQLPIAFGLLQADNGPSPETKLNVPQQQLTEDLAADFVQEIAGSKGDDKSGRSADGVRLPDSLRLWQSAVARADERFRALFGYEIYNREIIRQHQLDQ